MSNFMEWFRFYFVPFSPSETFHKAFSWKLSAGMIVWVSYQKNKSIIFIYMESHIEKSSL